MSHVHLLAIRLHIVEEPFQVVRRKVLSRDDDDRGAGGQPDRRKILRGVVLDVGIERRGRTMRAHMTHHDGVTVRLRLGRAGDPGGAACSRYVLDDNLLAERAGHVVADDARDHVGGAARREGDDHGDGARRVVALRVGARG
jgi:hypothetical protein